MTEPLPLPVPRGTPNLNKSLAAFQAEMPTLARDRAVTVETKGDKANYGYSYATLANVTAAAMPLLGKHGLSFTAFPGAGSDGKGMSLHYSLLHESGEERSGEFPLSAEGGIQILGGRITYVRRYCLLAVTGLAAEEDDDAVAAQDFDTNKGTAQRRAQPPAAPTRRPVASVPETPEGGQTAQRAARPVAEPPPLPGEGEEVDQPSKPMQTKLAMQFNDLEVTDRGERLALMTDMIGRPITSIKDLTKREAHAAIDAIDKALKTDNPLTTMLEIYQRTSGATAEPATRQPGQRSRNTAEAIGNGGDEGAEDAPWEGVLPV
jgi:ERF superfamily protein